MTDTENNETQDLGLDDVFEEGDGKVSELDLGAEEQNQETQEQQEVVQKTEEEDTSSEENKEVEVQEERETEEDTKKGEEESQESESEPPSQEKESWTKKAVIDERRKRQELEQKNAELLQQLVDLRTPREQKEEVKRPDPIDDPEGALEFDRIATSNEMLRMRIELSEEMMRYQHNDYEEMSNKFKEMAKNNTYLNQQLIQSVNPAKFAYETAKAHTESENFKDPNYLKELKEKMKKEILAELVSNQNSNSGDKPSVGLPNLTKKTSVASNIEPKEEYKGTLDECFDD